MSEFLDCFKIVWQMVNDKYIDPAFRGLDWNEVHNCYQPQIAAIEDDKTFYKLINKMLFELNVSHLGVISPDQKNRLEPIMSAEGSIGIDLRLLREKVMITAVERESSGQQAGLRPGFVVQEMNGQRIQQIASEFWLSPPFRDGKKRSTITSKIQEQVYGCPGTPVRLVYLDEGGEVHEVVIRCTPRAGKVVLGEYLPPVFIEFDSRRLDGDIGYIRFNTFAPPVHELPVQKVHGRGLPRASRECLRWLVGGTC